MAGKRKLAGKLHRPVALMLGTIVGTAGVAVGLGDRPSSALLRLAPVSLEMRINRVTGDPRLDLPPLNQRPTFYAELGLDDQSVTTSLIETPQIGASVYPDWSVAADKERVWVEPGHPIMATIRIFDQDDGQADQKVLLSALYFDPVACSVTVGSDTVVGDRTGPTCVVAIPNLQGENGSARLTLSAQW